MKRFSLTSFDQWILRQVLSVTGNPPFRLALDRGASVSGPKESAVATLHFSSRRSAIQLVLDPETGFGDAYARGEIVVEGDLVEALEAVFRTIQASRRVGWLSRPISWTLNAIQRHDTRGSIENARRHYDFGESFYRLWLDRQLVYSCAYYPVPDLTLEQAQIAKMDHVCRKLQLLRGERVVEAGCGWGALSLFMARHYGVTVRGFNVSREQIRYARWRAQQEGLEHRVEFVEDDYRNIGDGYDAFVSVGMLEHVGRENYPELGRVIQKAVGAKGRGLLHFIGRSHPEPLSTWIRERIFPGAYAPTVGECATILEPARFAILDVENLRPHYANTLAEWLLRFDEATEEMPSNIDETFLRAWRLYLAGSLAAFRTGWLQLFQVSFAGPEYSRVPWTREHLYTPHYTEQPVEAGAAGDQGAAGDGSGSQWTPAMS